MCIHERSTLDEVLRRHDPRYVSAVVQLTEEGEFVGAWHCDPSDERNIAQTIHNLRHWHPLLRPQFDLSMVNRSRALLNLPPLDEFGLPKPRGAPLPPMDEDRNVVAEWVKAARAATDRDTRRARRLLAIA